MIGSQLACVVVVVALAARAALAGAIEPAAPNALLVVDENNNRVLHVPLDGGEVTVFSPPEGAQANLLTSPRGIGTGLDGTIVVTNYFEGTLVEIDRATGAQLPVAGLLSGPPAIGSLPRDVAVNPREPTPGFFPTLGIAAQGELHQVVRNTFDTTGTLLAPYPSPYDPYLAHFVVARDPGTTDPIDYYIATDAVPAILRYDGATDTLATFRNYAVSVDSIHGLDAPATGPYQLVVSLRGEPCTGAGYDNGVDLIRTGGATDTLRGGSYGCPGPVALNVSTGVLYTIDATTNPQQVTRYDTGQGVPLPELTSLPSGTSAIDMALARVPEPSASALAVVASGALAVSVQARRRRSAG